MASFCRPNKMNSATRARESTISMRPARDGVRRKKNTYRANPSCAEGHETLTAAAKSSADEAPEIYAVTAAESTE